MTNIKIDKKLLTHLINVFLVIFLCSYIIHSFSFTHSAYQKYYHSHEDLIEEYKDKVNSQLFTDYETYIDTSKYPKTYKEYERIDNKYKSFNNNNLYDHLENKEVFCKDENNTRLKFVKSLEQNDDKPEILNEYKFVPFDDASLFYDKTGYLVFIQKEKDNHPCFYRYSLQGELLELEWYNHNVNVVYTPDKEPKYRFYMSGCCSYVEYKISYEEYIIKVHRDILISSIVIFLLYLLYRFIKNNTIQLAEEKYYYENIKHDFIKNLKTHFWPHYLMLAGWFTLFYSIFIFIDEHDFYWALIIFIVLAHFMLLPFPIILLFENFIFKGCRVKWKFLIENRYYNIIWIIGFILSILLILFFVGIYIYGIEDGLYHMFNP